MATRPAIPTPTPIPACAPTDSPPDWLLSAAEDARRLEELEVAAVLTLELALPAVALGVALTVERPTVVCVLRC